MRQLIICAALTITMTLALAGCKTSARQEVARVPAGSAMPSPYAMDADAQAMTQPVVIQQEQVVVTDTFGPENLGQDPASFAPAASISTTYTIQKGDTLWSIAKQHYGKGQDYLKILDANPGLVPQKLAVGQSIALP